MHVIKQDIKDTGLTRKIHTSFLPHLCNENCESLLENKADEDTISSDDHLSENDVYLEREADGIEAVGNDENDEEAEVVLELSEIPDEDITDLTEEYTAIAFHPQEIGISVETHNISFDTASSNAHVSGSNLNVSFDQTEDNIACETALPSAQASLLTLSPSDTSWTPSKPMRKPVHASTPLHANLSVSVTSSSSPKEDWSPSTKFGRALSIVRGEQDIIKKVDRNCKKLKEGTRDISTEEAYKDDLAQVQTMV